MAMHITFYLDIMLSCNLRFHWSILQSIYNLLNYSATYPTYPVECGDVGPIQSRIYTIYPLDSQVGVDVYCEMEYDGGGWTVSTYPLFVNLLMSSEKKD